VGGVKLWRKRHTEGVRGGGRGSEVGIVRGQGRVRGKGRRGV